MRSIALSLLVGLSFARGLVAAEPPLTALRCAAAIDVVHGTRIDRAVVLIRDSRIVQVGPDLPIPPEAQVIDLGDATVLPGLIDAHTHLLLRFLPSLGDENTNNIVALSTVEPTYRALMGAAMAREMLAAGFTTVRDLGNSGHNGDVAVRDAIERGWAAGPRMIVSTRALAPPGGQFSKLATLGRALAREEYVEVTGADAARNAVREAVFDGAAVIKVIVDGGMTPAQILRATTVDAARLLGMDADVGTLAAGKYADVLAVCGDPLADVRALEQVRMVFKGGAAVTPGGGACPPAPQP